MVTDACETWTLSVGDINSLVVSETQTVRRIYGPVQTEEGWRIDEQLEKLMRIEGIVKYITAQRIK
jgi:hypothetical protein